MVLFASLLLEFICKQRNLVVHDGERSSSLSLGRNLNASFLSYSSSLCVPNCTASSSQQLPPPPFGLKININAAVRSNFSVAARVVRNSDSLIISVVSGKFCCISPLAAEASALLMAALLVKDKGWNYMVFETDCQVVASQVRSLSASCPWEVRDIVSNLLMAL